MSTIYALATPRAKAGLAVLRVSGPDAHAAVERLAGPLPPPRQAGLRRLRDSEGNVLDEAIVIAFQAGGSYTGEPTAELQCHGSVAVIDALLNTFAAMPGLHPAGPGEFTRRALENGRMDVSQVEGLADLIDAETEEQRRQAWRLLDGSAGRTAERWRRDLIRARSMLEATIDFVDDDVPPDVLPDVLALTRGVREEIDEHLKVAAAAERLRDGFEVAVVGPPNVGKSSFINAIARRDAAIVTAVPGTTRDVLEVRMDLGGLPVTMLDTAGLRATEDPVERIGVAKAAERATAADLRIILLPEPGSMPVPSPRDGDVVALSRCDLFEGLDGISALTGHGLSGVMTAVREELSTRLPRSSSFGRHRHHAALSEAHDDLKRLEDEVVALPIEVAVELLIRATQALGSIIGTVGVEVVLDELFGTFCIGK